MYVLGVASLARGRRHRGEDATHGTHREQVTHPHLPQSSGWAAVVHPRTEAEPSWWPRHEL